MGWPGPILTDSGGFQVFSLGAYCQRSEAGVEFRSPVDGRTVFLSPERAIEIQEALGADFIVVLDEFEAVEGGGDPEQARTRACLERSLRWARAVARRTAGGSAFAPDRPGRFAGAARGERERTRELGFEAFATAGLRRRGA
jgi:queuine tRNA-ribosyltransferase